MVESRPCLTRAQPENCSEDLISACPETFEVLADGFFRTFRSSRGCDSRTPGAA